MAISMPKFADTTPAVWPPTGKLKALKIENPFISF
jgi:hypothetical protein